VHRAGDEVVGQEKKGGNDDVVLAAAVDSTSVDDDHSGGGGGPVVGPETKGNDDIADAMVDAKNKIIVDDVSGKEFDSNEIDRMQNNMRKSLLKRRYKEVRGEDHGYQSPPH
jgi:tRNA G37 N-methylase TrmD